MEMWPSAAHARFTKFKSMHLRNFKYILYSSAAATGNEMHHAVV